MARKRRDGEPSSYEPQTPVPAEQARRYELVMAVLSGQMTISDAANELGIARVNMQTLVHRAQAALVESLTPKPPGRTPTPPRERALTSELEKVQKRNLKLETQLLAMDDMLGTAGEIIRHLRGLPPQSATSSSKRSPRSRKPATTSSDEDPEPPSSTQSSTQSSEIQTTLATRATMMADHGARAARAIGVRVHTLRRWRHRLRRGEALVRRRGGRRPTVTAEQQAQLRGHVRALGGLVGAASLSHSVDGVSRRAAARIKREELAAMERERRAACVHVRVTTPGVVRGFDAMFAAGNVLLIAADASVPFRTSAVRVPAYDAEHVARALHADFSEHGAPLVLRCDRARCHDAPAVVSVLRTHAVLCLHGPPRHPMYYGQLERQNREHRSWLEHADDVRPDTLTEMRLALNGRWRRPTLQWRTAEDVWQHRPPLTVDRKALDEDVRERAARLREHGLLSDLAMRLAIEQALIERGYLHLTSGDSRYVNRHPH